MKLLHMVSGDPLRTPTVVSWNEPNAWVQTSGCAINEVSCINPAFAWMHGGIQPEIAQTWLGLVGPGVKKRGIDDDTWTDHTDVRPTMLALLGLEDDYLHDGRVIVEHLDPEYLPGHFGRIRAGAPISGWRAPISSSMLRSASCRRRASNTQPPRSRPTTR